jgi:TonB family protein
METLSRRFVVKVLLILTFIFVVITACAQGTENASHTPDSPNTPIYRVGGGVSAPRVIYAPHPEYSEKARKAKYGATCTLSIVVGSDGIPRDIKVYDPIGMDLDEKAVEAVKKWRFQPARKNGHPVAVQISVEVNFQPR